MRYSRLSKQPSSLMRRKAQTPAAGLYYAAVAVLTEAGKVTKWVRRRDLRKGYYGTEKVVETYWELKLKCTCLWAPEVASGDATATARPRLIDSHSPRPAVDADERPTAREGHHRPDD